MNDRRIIEHEDRFNCHRRDFSKEKSAKGICNGGVYADKIEFRF